MPRAAMSPQLTEARERLRRVPIVSVHDLFTLAPEEITEGYQDAKDGLPCGDNRSRAYWHGWRNGMIDSGKIEKDAFALLLAKDLRERGIDIASLDALHREKFKWLQSIGLA